MPSLVRRETLGVLRPTSSADRYGTDRPKFPAASDAVPIPGWAVDAGDTTEDEKGREGTVVLYTARGPFAADVRSQDRIVWRGTVFEVEGGVLRQPGPTARSSHTIVRLRKAEG